MRDRYGDYPAEKVTDPAGPDSGDKRVIRGGAWSNNARLLRVSFRDMSKPDVKNKYIGFRCAANPK